MAKGPRIDNVQVGNNRTGQTQISIFSDEAIEANIALILGTTELCLTPSFTLALQAQYLLNHKKGANEQ